VDLHYLVASGRLDAETAHHVWAVTSYPDVNIRSTPITAAISERFGHETLTSLRDPWDRMIVATGAEHGLPIVTADEAITSLARSTGVVEVIW
jgi:PIN domain nuclease of toxin-antitoxin system